METQVKPGPLTLSNAVNSPFNATWTVPPLRSSAKRWAARKVGSTSGVIATKPTIRPGLRK